MKTKLQEQAEKALPIIQAIIEGSPRVKNYLYKIGDIPTRSSYLESFLNSWYLEDLKFPELPEGEEWHNPHCLTPEQVEVDKGWRLLTKSERENNDKVRRIRYDIQLWTSDVWYNSGYGNDFTVTYRTKNPLPEPAQEMTVAEIEKALGKRIKIVK